MINFIVYWLIIPALIWTAFVIYWLILSSSVDLITSAFKYLNTFCSFLWGKILRK